MKRLLLNIERSDRHLRPLILDANLSQMALGYSKQLRNLQFFSHNKPVTMLLAPNSHRVYTSVRTIDVRRKTSFPLDEEPLKT